MNIVTIPSIHLWCMIIILWCQSFLLGCFFADWNIRKNKNKTSLKHTQMNFKEK